MIGVTQSMTACASECHHTALIVPRQWDALRWSARKRSDTFCGVIHMHCIRNQRRAFRRCVGCTIALQFRRQCICTVAAFVPLEVSLVFLHCLKSKLTEIESKDACRESKVHCSCCIGRATYVRCCQHSCSKQTQEHSMLQQQYWQC